MIKVNLQLLSLDDVTNSILLLRHEGVTQIEFLSEGMYSALIPNGSIKNIEKIARVEIKRKKKMHV